MGINQNQVIFLELHHSAHNWVTSQSIMGCNQNLYRQWFGTEQRQIITWTSDVTGRHGLWLKLIRGGEQVSIHYMTQWSLFVASIIGKMLQWIFDSNVKFCLGERISGWRLKNDNHFSSDLHLIRHMASHTNLPHFIENEIMVNIWYKLRLL